MLRLSGTDTMMLAAETPGWHFHVGGLTLIECDGDSHAMVLRIADEVERRLALAPKFRWKLKTVPFGLDQPVWVRDEHFDVGRHLHFRTLPAPGGRRELAELAGQIMSRQLDRRYPLWEMYLIEGLANHRVAMLLKSHHCMMDGVSGASLATVLSDIEPHPAKLPSPNGDEPEPGSDSSWPYLLAAAVPHLLKRPARFARYGMALAQRLATIATFSDPTADVYRFMGAPRMSFNGAIGPERTFGFSSVSLRDVRAIKERFEVKTNDVMMALCAGALRSYLIANGEPVDTPLVSGVPVSTRGADTTLNNQIGNMCVKLATDIPDPVQRLLRISENARAAKQLHREIRSHAMPSAGEVAPPLVLHTVLRTMYESRLMSLFPTPMNTLISNVAGPPFDLYTAGGRVTGIFPSSVITETMALNITLFSYGDRVDFGVSADPQAVADPFLVADGIPAALRELLAAAKLGAPTPVIDAFGESTDTVAVGAAAG